MVLAGGNSYTGGTIVSAGTLAVTGSLPSTGTVLVNGGMLDGTSASGAVPALKLTSGAAIVGMGLAVTSGSVSAGVLNFNGTQAGNNLVLTGGTVNFGNGAQLASANFSAGSGVANAANPLAVTGTLKLSGSLTAAYTARGGATSFTAGGGNIVNDTLTGASARTLTISGGTLGLSAPPPAIGSASSTTSTTAPYAFTPASNNVLLGLSGSVSGNGYAGQQGTGNVPTGAVTMLTNGAISNTGVEATDLPNVYTIGNSTTITYTLPGNGVGFDLSKINIYSEWNDAGRAQINVSSISYSTVANPTVFNTITNSSVTSATGLNEYSGSLTASGGALASNVYAVRFNFGGQQNNWVGYAELEAVGARRSASTRRTP